jgi:hypothetical protein
MIASTPFALGTEEYGLRQTAHQLAVTPFKQIALWATRKLMWLLAHSYTKEADFDFISVNSC